MLLVGSTRIPARPFSRHHAEARLCPLCVPPRGCRRGNTGHASQLLVGDELPKPTGATPLRGVFFWLWLVAPVGTTIFWLPRSYTKEPDSRSALVEPLAVGGAVVAVEGASGIPSGMCDVLDGCRAHDFGGLGWELLELDRIWQDLLLAGVGLWVPILLRGVQNVLTWESMRSTPAWLRYGCSTIVFFRSLLPLGSPASVILTEQLSLKRSSASSSSGATPTAPCSACRETSHRPASSSAYST